MPSHEASWPQKHPLLAAAIFFAIGIAFQIEIAFTLKTTLWLLCVALAWIPLSWRRLTPPWPIAPLIILAAMLLTQSRTMVLDEPLPHDVRELVPRTPQHARLQGRVATDPALSETGLQFEVETSRIELEGFWKNTKGRVLVRIADHKEKPGKSKNQNPIGEGSTPSRGASKTDSFGPLIPRHPEGGASSQPHRSTVRDGDNNIAYGKEIELEGVLAPPRTARNFGLFDEAEYLRRMEIFLVLQVHDHSDAKVLGVSNGFEWIFRGRQAIAQRLTLGIEDRSLAVGIIRGMLLGYREDIPREVNHSFRRTGTLHVFAISGSHISLIALSLLFLLKPTQLPKAWCCWIVLPTLTLYVVATGLRASSIRSLVMAAVVILGWSLERPSALLNNLAAAALLILIWDPLQLIDTGFQLSFVVVASLILVAPWMEKEVTTRLQPDPFIPTPYVPPWRRAIVGPSQMVASLLVVSLAAWIGSLWINIYYFHLLSFVSLLANLLIVPLASASVGIGVASLLLGCLWNELAVTLNTSHALLIELMVAISQELGSWKVGYIYVPQIAVGWIVLGYAWIAGMLFSMARKKWGNLIILLLLGGLTISTATALAWRSREIRVDVMDLGSGQCVLVTGPHFERILVDAGSARDGRYLVEPFLRSRGVNAIDLAILSHGDSAHFGGFADVMAEIPIRRVIVSDAPFRSPEYRLLLAKIRASRIPLEEWNMGKTTTLELGTLHALWPPEHPWGLSADDLALVLEMQTPHGNLLLAADIGDPVERKLSGFAQPCSALIQGINATESSLTAFYLAEAHPKFLLLNTAEWPLKARPSPETQKRMEESDARIHRTDQQGGAILRFNEKGVTVEPFRPLPR